MNELSVLDDLREILSTNNVAYFDSTKKSLITRCPYCGDSVKNLKHGHLYISTTPPFPFFCHRCESKGYLNITTLKDFNVDDPHVTLKVNDIAKKAIRNTSKKSETNFILSDKKLLLPQYNLDSKIFKRKKIYLEERFDNELSIEDLYSLKVITNYKDFIDYNNLTNMVKYFKGSSYHEDLYHWLRVYGVGFLSMDTNYVGFRYTKIPLNNRRYYTESNRRPLDIGSRIYTISNELDLFTPTLNLVLCEGVMDITSVWINIYDKLKSPDTVFGSVNGRAYKAFIHQMRKLGFLKINLDIYSDNDVSLSNYKYNLDLSNFSKVKVHYNTYSGEKDFGVPKSRIKDKVYILK